MSDIRQRRFAANSDWMMTFSGRRFYPLDPRPQDVDFNDIAHALSLLCRYGGHAGRFYSVAEHCRLLAEYFESRGELLNARYALLHDSPEAYVGDMVRPLKRGLPAFAMTERKVERAVFKAAGLEPDIPAAVLQADTAIIANEAKELFAVAAREAAEWVLDVQPLPGVSIAGFSPAMAERHFRQAFDRLFPELSR